MQIPGSHCGVDSCYLFGEVSSVDSPSLFPSSIGSLIFSENSEHFAASCDQCMFFLKLRTAVLVTGTRTRSE